MCSSTRASATANQKVHRPSAAAATLSISHWRCCPHCSRNSQSSNPYCSATAKARPLHLSMLHITRKMCAPWCSNRRSFAWNRPQPQAWPWPNVRGARPTSVNGWHGTTVIPTPSSPPGSASATPTACSLCRWRRTCRRYDALCWCCKESLTNMQPACRPMLRPLAPQMRLVRLSDIGHTPHREQPELVLELIESFLSQLPAQPSPAS
jgi:hypothetical protein